MIQLLLTIGALVVASPSAFGQDVDPNEIQRFEEVQAAFERQDFERSREILEELVRLRPTETAYWFNLGNTNLKTGRYEEAVRCYQEVVDRKGELSEAARLYTGKTLIAAGKTGDATRVLRVLEQSAESEVIRAAARADLSALEVASSRGSLGGALEASFGTNSNIYTTAISAQGETPDPISARSSQLALTLRHLYAFKNDLQARTDLSGYWEETLGRRMDRYMSASLSPGVIWNLSSAWKLGMVPQLVYELYGGAPYFLRPGFQLELSSEQGRFRFAHHSRLQRNLAISSDSHYLAGVSVLSQFFLGISHGTADLEGTLAYVRETNSDYRTEDKLLPLAFHGMRIGGNARLALHRRLTLSLRPNWTWKFYDHVSIPYGVRRSDLLISLPIRVDFVMNTSIALFGGATWTINQSRLGEGTVVNKNYDQQRFNFGLCWTLNP